MTPVTPNVDDAYREYIDLQLAHHALLSAGKDDTPEAEAVEDRMTALWLRLDAAQRASLNGIAADLGWVRRAGQPPPRGRTPEQVTEEEMSALGRVPGGADYHAMLYHLRVCAPRLPVEALAYARAAYYHKLGFQGLSVAFADFAVGASPDNNTIGRRAFDALMRYAPGTAFQRAVAITEAPTEYAPLVVVLGIGYLVDTLGGPTSFDAPRVVSDVRAARQRLADAPNTAEDRVAFCQIAGALLVGFGDQAEGVELYEAGLGSEPENPAILAGLGMAIYDSEKPRAVGLFRRAILAGAKFIRPYIHLAHYHLARREFTLALGYAKQALELARDDAARSAALEMMAISATELGVDPAQVMKLFREAAKLSRNPRIAANLKAFEDSVSGRSAKAEWDYREDPAALQVTEPSVRIDTEAAEFTVA